MEQKNNSCKERTNKSRLCFASLIYEMQRGDTMAVKLHEGALKGGGSHPFTSFLGIKVGGNTHNIFPNNPNIQNEIQN